MHPKHRVLLKKNAKMIDAERSRAFYFVADKQTDNQILHIDRKIRQATKFANVKKVNRTLEAFDDDAYQVSTKARLCAGTVTRDDKGLVFSIDIKRGLSEALLARSLKQFKKLIGKAIVSKGDGDIDVDEASDEAETADLSAVGAALRAYAGSAGTTRELLGAWTSDGASQDDERYDTLLQRFADESLLVDAAMQAVDAFVQSGTEPGLGADVDGRTLDAWLAELEAWEGQLSGRLGIAEDADVDLTAEVRSALQEANLSPEQVSSVEQAQQTLSSWLLQQQEIFRRPDTQLDGLISGDEVFFTKDGERVPMTTEAILELGLESAFDTDDGGMLIVRDDILTEDGISPEGRAQIAAVLVGAVEKGFDLHLRNPSSTSDVSELDLRATEDGVAQRTTRQGPAAPTNLQFDRQDEIVPGTEPAVSFRDLMAGMNAASSDEEFALLNEMMNDAYLVEVADGKVDPSMSFLQYKMQFVDLEVPNLLESGLRWHDGSGQLNVAEWAFAQLRVKDLPEKTQYNYMIEIASPYLTKKRFERTMDLGIKPPTIPTEDDIYAALAADGFWAKYAGGKDLVEYYKGDAKISVKLGYADPDNGWTLTWDDTGEPFFTGKVTGQDEVLPLINDIPESALRTLTTDADGETKDPRTGEAIDLAGDVDGAREQTADAISKSVMKAALSAWTRGSGEAVGDLLKPIPDSQKVFLRQSNGTVNAIRIGNGDLRGNLKEIASMPGLEEPAAHLEGLLTQQPLNRDAIRHYCDQISAALDNWIERVRDEGGDEGMEETYARLSEATTELRDIELTDIGQTDVITSGNDTGAFGKCAPVAYFCGSMCGIAVQARKGLDTLGAGSEVLKGKAADLEALMTGRPMDALQREALDEQLDDIVKQIESDHSTRRAEVAKDVRATEEWGAVIAENKAAADKVIDEAIAALRATRSRREQNRIRERAYAELREINQRQRDGLQGLYNDALGGLDKEKKDQLAAVEKVRQLKVSTLDRLVVEEDDEGPYFDMRFPVPRAAMYKRGGRDGWLLDKYGSPLPDLAKEHPDEFFTHPKTGELHFKVKVRPGDIQEYLEETNREDKYRGQKKHMMDFFKDPSSMNNIQLMEDLGPGLVAVGLDKGLKDLGKDSGLLYGPGADVVATMVYGEQKGTTYANLKEEMPKKGTPEYEREFKKRRGALLGKLKQARDDNGSIAVSMGFKSANGHVNFVQSWGTPSIDGVEISADDIARCRMNISENPAGSSAWNNDRVQAFPINPAAIARGVGNIEQALRESDSAKEETIVAARAVRGKALAAAQKVDGIIEDMLRGSGIYDEVRDMEPFPGEVNQEKLVAARNARLAEYEARVKVLTDEYVKNEGMEEKAAKEKAENDAWEELDLSVKLTINSTSNVQKDPEYSEYLDMLREASADAMAFLKDSMRLEQSDEGLNEDNVLIMPSNTERDNAVSDNEEDRERVGAGNIGSQKYGSANATDASYFVPVNALASGWDGVVEGDWSDDETDCTATRYNYSDDQRDQFVMLASMTVMRDR